MPLKNTNQPIFRIQKKACSTCIYRKDSPLDLPRLEKQALSKDSYRICHHSNDVCCRGFWNRHKNNFTWGQLAQRLGWVRFVSVDNHKEATPTSKKDR